MLTHWRLAGLLQKLGGLGFGSFKGCEASDDVFPEKTFQLKEVLIDRSYALHIPVIGNLPVGHCYGNASLPLGRIAILDGKKGLLKLRAS